MITKKKLGLLATAIGLILAGVILYFSIGRGPNFGRIPVGWERVQTFGNYGANYQGKGTIEEALRAFRIEMEKAGWSHVRDESYEGFNALFLEKEDLEAMILAIQIGPDTVAVSVLAAKAREQQGKPFEIPTKDIEGEDISGIPRYPDSVRTVFEGVPDSIFVSYLAKAALSQITDFYTQELPANDWTLEGVSYDEETQTATIFAIKTDVGFVEITISKRSGLEDYSDIEIVLTKL